MVSSTIKSINLCYSDPPLHPAHRNGRPWAAIYLLYVCIVTTRGVLPTRRQMSHVHEASVVFQIGAGARSPTAPPEALVQMNGKQAVSDGIQTGVKEAKYEKHVCE